MQECTNCHKEKSFDDFRRASKVKDGHQAECKECRSEKDKPYREQNKLKAREYRRTHKKIIAEQRKRRYLANLEKHKDQQLKRAFGITLEEYDALLLKQKGVCMICGKPESKRKLSVDHDHKTGRVRGLLCNHCNRLLGDAYDNIKILQSAISYLQLAQVQKEAA